MTSSPSSRQHHERPCHIRSNDAPPLIVSLSFCPLTFSLDDMFHRLESFRAHNFFFFLKRTLSTTTYHIENAYSIFVYAANTYRHPHSHHLSSLPSILRYIYVVPFFAMFAPSQLPPFFPFRCCLVSE